MAARNPPRPSSTTDVLRPLYPSWSSLSLSTQVCSCLWRTRAAPVFCRNPLCGVSLVSLVGASLSAPTTARTPTAALLTPTTSGRASLPVCYCTASSPHSKCRSVTMTAHTASSATHVATERFFAVGHLILLGRKSSATLLCDRACHMGYSTVSGVLTGVICARRVVCRTTCSRLPAALSPRCMPRRWNRNNALRNCGMRASGILLPNAPVRRRGMSLMATSSVPVSPVERVWLARFAVGLTKVGFRAPATRLV